MFTDEQINQLQKIVSPIQEELQNLRGELAEHRQESQIEHQDLRVELAEHRRESQMEHQDLVQVIVESSDTMDKRITRVENHLHLSPLE